MALRDTPLDLALVGATGFTGGLTAHYLARHAPAGLRWALAGRNIAKLEAVKAELVEINPDLADLRLVQADSGDPASLTELARQCGVIATTVGPYRELGEPLVAACAEVGTDYVDLTGEPEFVDTMYVRHHAAAERSGARIVHACGFDSVPHDLGAFYTVRELAATGPVTMRGVVRAGASFSGGTFHSALGAFSNARAMSAALKERRRVEPRPEGRKARAVSGKPHKDAVTGYYLLPMPTIDPFVVVRSAAALPEYGPDFCYSHFAGTKTLRYAAGGAAGVGAIALAAQVPPLRNALKKRVKQGEGPSPARREKSWFTVDFVAEGDGRQVRTRVSGGDPGYDETAKMLAESALCLAFDDNPWTAGCVTTAQAMGENLLDRLRARGMRFETLD
ncbi:saccharopine dehydrogenase family protein [Nocardioides acrostichi]|uniref:Saccharopine dehydrogenase NADP-binding domain-containing protein n=1 Tax=Nocardioides acrostichi TaxID=2784339 RepID=A0A930V4F0_9ACTN|nr:saccharopine dehydrogenase NADP-binding domain-containing protein [Nocardioides acrostichi]MBF4163637.1 saccharopine dehydrogenase NADP-binding domain-containing protein [Nocardioides acrostichi]